MKAFDTLRIFVTTIKLGSLSAAARSLGLSPATISRRIQLLEVELGVQLLDRSTRNIRATESGEAFYQHVSLLLDGMRRAEDAARENRKSPEGRLRIHSRSLIGTRAIAPLVCQFSQAYPDIRIELDLSEEPADLLEHDYDVDLRVGRIEDSSYIIRKLTALENVLVASPQYLKRNAPIRKPTDLLGHNCLAWRRSSEQATWWYMDGSELKSLAVTGTLFSNTGEVLRLGAINGQGIALLSDLTVRDALQDGSLVRVLSDHRFSLGTFDNGVYIVFRPTKPLPTKIRVFVDFMAQAFKV